MPPKRGPAAKGKGKGKEDEIRAAEEAARQRQEAELQRLRAEDEDRRRREFAAKQQQEEENQRKRKEEEDRRMREETERRAQEDDERKQRERERDIQQLRELEEKDNEINKLSEKVFAVNRSLAQTHATLDAEVIRSEALTTELERAQMRLVQFEDEAEKKQYHHSQRTKDLESELHQCALECESLTQTAKEKTVEAAETRAVLGLEIQQQAEEMAKREEKRKADDEENATLMGLLNTELSKYKHQATQLEGDLEKKEKEDVKNTIMLALMNSQLDVAKEEGQKQSDRIYDLTKANEVLAAQLEEATGRILQFEDDQDAADREHTVARDVMVRELDLYKAKVEQLNGACQTLQEELEATKAELSDHRHEASQRDRTAFEERLAIKQELQYYKNLSTRQSEDQERKAASWQETTTFHQEETDRLKATNAQLTDDAEQARREAFERETELQSQVDQAKALCQQREAQMEERDRQAQDRFQAVTEELGEERRGREQDKALAEKTSKDHFETITRISSDLDATQRHLTHVTATLEKREKEFVDSTVALASEKERFRTRQEFLQEELDKASVEGARRTEELQGEVQKWRREKEDQESIHLHKQQEWETTSAAAAKDMKQAQQRIAQLDELNNKKDKDHWDRCAHYKKEIQKKQQEIDGHADTIRRLEETITENYNYKVITEQNELLKMEVDTQRQKIANLHTTLNTMKVETDILENYKTKVLAEQNEQYLHRIQQLEMEHRTIAPLMSDLITTLQQNGLTSPLAPDIDAYQQLAILAAPSPSHPSAPALAPIQGSRVSTPPVRGRQKLDPIPSRADHWASADSVAPNGGRVV